MLGRPLFSISLGSLCAIVVSCTSAASPPAVQQATRAAESWLKLVDDGNYSASYKNASLLFRAAVSEDQWAKTVGPVRKPLGAVISRKLAKAQYATSLPGAPDGQYVVIKYETSFENKESAIETVTPMFDKDGVWRVSGYYIK